MTSEARTCTVDMGACRCGEGREWHDRVPEHAYAGFCGLPLVDDEASPCAECGRHHEGLCLMGPGDDASYVASAYRCPVHGAVK